MTRQLPQARERHAGPTPYICPVTHARTVFDERRQGSRRKSTESLQFPLGEKRPSYLKTFDNNFANGSPSASFNAMSIEPDLPVLVVDDDPLTRTLMKRILQTRLGCQVSVAENGEVALENDSRPTDNDGCNSVERFIWQLWDPYWSKRRI